jgi:hypothetical protein
MQQPDPDRLERLLNDLRVWARDLPAQGSERYGTICAGLADDPQRAAIILGASPGFRSPLVLLAAVHHLLLTGARHELGAYYATIVGVPAARAIDDGLYPAFAAFVDAHRDRLEDLVATRTTQTNEARRTVVTLPALGLVQGRARSPLVLLEVGASAGLNLVPDRYGYRIGTAPAGDQASPVQIDCAVQGDLLPPIPPRLDIAWRAGLDLNPLDVRDASTRDWLRALTWPEQPDRLQLLDAALELARRDPPRLVRGDLVDDLPAVAADAPPTGALVMTCTWTLAYLEAERRRAFIGALADLAASEKRTIWLVAGEAESVVASLELGIAKMPSDGGFGHSTLTLHGFGPDGEREHRLLAIVHPHGRWIRWLDAATAASPAGAA